MGNDSDLLCIFNLSFHFIIFHSHKGNRRHQEYGHIRNDSRHMALATFDRGCILSPNSTRHSEFHPGIPERMVHKILRRNSSLVRLTFVIEFLAI